MAKFYLVYQITNKLNGMIYVGAHQTNRIEDGYMGSGTALKKAQFRDGKENFERIILHRAPDRETMYKLEEAIVSDAFIARKDTYNLVNGGDDPDLTRSKTRVNGRKKLGIHTVKYKIQALHYPNKGKKTYG
jgi:hypothetical protein